MFAVCSPSSHAPSWQKLAVERVVWLPGASHARARAFQTRHDRLVLVARTSLGWRGERRGSGPRRAPARLSQGTAKFQHRHYTTDPHTTDTHACIEGRLVARVAVPPTQVRLQTRLAAFTAVGGGPLAMLRHTLRAEGASALYQGLSPRLLTNGLVKLSLFSLYERWLPLCGGSPMLAGGLAGACNSLLSCPQDVLKSKLQARSSSSSSSSSSSRSSQRRCSLNSLRPQPDGSVAAATTYGCSLCCLTAAGDVCGQRLGGAALPPAYAPGARAALATRTRRTGLLPRVHCSGRSR